MVYSIMSSHVSLVRIVEWLIVALLLVTLWPLCSRGQEGQLTAFHGGDCRSQMLLASGLLFGMGSRNSSLGGTCTGLEYGVEDLYWNPGRLGFLPRAGAMVDLVLPFFSLDATALVDLNGEAVNAVDDLVAEMGSADLVLDSDDYPDVQATLGQKSRVQSIGVASPLAGWAAGMSFCRTVGLDLELMGTGLQACFSAELEEVPDEEMVFSSSADLSLLLDIQVNTVSFALGRRISPRWSLGLAAERYDGYSSANGRLQAEGLIAIAGYEAAFNDPNAEWTDQLFSKMAGCYHGAAWGWKLGTSCRLLPNLSLDGVLIFPTTLWLDGEMEIIQYSLPQSIDLESDEPLHPDQADLDEPTRTQLEEIATANQVAIDFPGSFKLGAAWKFSGITALLQYGHYFGEFSGTYPIAEAAEPVTYRLGLRPTDAITLGFDLRFVRLGGGLLAGWSFYHRQPEEDQEPEESWTVVPMLTMGTGFGLGGGHEIDLLLFSAPEDLMRVTTIFQF